MRAILFFFCWLVCQNLVAQDTLCPYIKVQRPNGRFNLINCEGNKLLKMDYNHIEVLDEKTALTSVRDIYYLVELNSGESFKTFHECRIHVVDGILRVENNSGSTEYYTFSGVEIPGF